MKKEGMLLNTALSFNLNTVLISHAAGLIGMELNPNITVNHTVPTRKRKPVSTLLISYRSLEIFRVPSHKLDISIVSRVIIKVCNVQIDIKFKFSSPFKLRILLWLCLWSRYNVILIDHLALLPMTVNPCLLFLLRKNSHWSYETP